MGLGAGRLAVFLLACLLAAGGIGAAIGEALSGTESARALDSIELRKDDQREEIADEDAGDPDGDGTRGDDGTRGGSNTGDGDRTRGNDGTRGGNNTGDGDWTAGNDGTGGGDNSYVAPAPAPDYGGGGGGYSDDGGGTDG